MKDNLFFYDKLKEVPAEAQKEIQSGRIAGMTDINPMWRIKAMTDAFGVCGFGWKYEITKQWNEQYGDVVKTYCNINLYVKVDGEWSNAIPGTGGSSFVSIERNGAFVSDENNKMALTDALSVAMKALGVGANVYWEKGRDFETKYSVVKDTSKPNNVKKPATPAVENNELSTAELLTLAKDELAQAITAAELRAICQRYPMLRTNTEFLAAGTARKKALGIQ